MIASD